MGFQDLNNNTNTESNLINDSSGMSTVGRPVTATLYVNPNGDNSDGSSWEKAYNCIEDALDAASILPSECTAIFVAPHPTFYDINRTGDPTWSGNYIIKGIHRNWAKIKNTHASATSIFKFTGRVGLEDLNINLGTGMNGVIFTAGGFRVDSCMFIGEDLTSAATAIHIDGATSVKNGKIRTCDIKGESTMAHMTGILLDNANCTDMLDNRIGFCINGIKQVGANSSFNRYKRSEFCTCAIAANLDEGSGMSFDDVLFYKNTLNIDDEIGNNSFSGINGEFVTAMYPENLSGIEITAGDGVWGADTELRAAVTATKPFKVISFHLAPSNDESTMIRFSADSGTTFFTQSIFASKKDKATSNGDATDFIFNPGTRISASVWSPAGGRTVNTWIEIQEI